MSKDVPTLKTVYGGLKTSFGSTGCPVLDGLPSAGGQTSRLINGQEHV